MGIINNMIMKMSKKLKKVPVQHTNELPDCVISYIFSKLNMKDLVKTSALSKRWMNEWESRMDLNFDLQNMFDTNVIQDFYSFLNSCETITDRIQLFDKLQYQFARRIDQFMFNYQGDKIHSLRVDFPLGDEQSGIIDRGDHMKISSIKAHQLLKFYLDAKGEEEIPCAFDLIASLHKLENLALVMDHSKIERIPRNLGPFQHLRQLEFFIDDETYKPDPDDDFFWIKHPHLAANKRQMKEHRGFSHNELKYVELRGCAGNINEIELARHFLKNVNSLKRISIGPCGRFYKGDRKWTSVFGNCDWFPRVRKLIREMLEDEVSEQCQLRVF
ncbi:F-box-like domain superfamily [Sesbania bispinosa]|nr:F-box-like domain superfamily [Sesbania bispinosa]